MDTRDQNSDLASPAMSPDTTVRPPLPDTLDMVDDTALITTTGDRIPPLDQKKAEKSPTPFQEALKRLRRDTRAMISLTIIVLFIVVPIFGPFIYQHIGTPYQSALNGTIGPELYHNPFHQELENTDLGPTAQYWLGTDGVGRDLLARLMQGMLISIVVAVLVEIVDIVLGVLIGVLAGYYGGWIDQLLARFTDVMFAFPGLLFAILLSGIFGQYAENNAFLNKIPIIGTNGDARLVIVSVALAFTAWPLMARYVRGQTLQIKEQQFIEAARTAGTSDARILLRHIVPNLFSIVIVASTLNISNTIIGEAGLSLLNLGVQEPGSSLGVMISDATQSLAIHPWEILLPSLVLTIIVLAFSFFGDGLRDALDPRSRD
jgi:oligopeptide transport system permease protein